MKLQSSVEKLSAKDMRPNGKAIPFFAEATAIFRKHTYVPSMCYLSKIEKTAEIVTSPAASQSRNKPPASESITTDGSRPT